MVLTKFKYWDNNMSSLMSSWAGLTRIVDLALMYGVLTRKGELLILLV